MGNKDAKVVRLEPKEPKPPRRDEAIVDDLKAQLAGLVTLMNEAAKAGLVINFNIAQRSQNRGPFILSALTITKKLT